MPSSVFYKKGKAATIKGKVERYMTYQQIQKYEAYKNGKGLELLEKAINNPRNRVIC